MDKKKRGRRPKGEVKELEEVLQTSPADVLHEIVICMPLTERDIADLERVPVQIDYKEKYHKYKSTAQIWKKRCQELEDQLLNQSSSAPRSRVTELPYLRDRLQATTRPAVQEAPQEAVQGAVQGAEAIACHWCCHTFDTAPCMVPERVIDGKYEVFGNLCSFNCALSYILDMRDERVLERIALLHAMYRKVAGSDAPEIKPAPRRETLKLFGGCLDITKYRENFVIPNEEITYYLTNLAPLVPLVEVKYHDKYKPTEMLKRTKPRITQYSLGE